MVLPPLYDAAALSFFLAGMGMLRATILLAHLVAIGHGCVRSEIGWHVNFDVSVSSFRPQAAVWPITRDKL